MAGWQPPNGVGQDICAIERSGAGRASDCLRVDGDCLHESRTALRCQQVAQYLPPQIAVHKHMSLPR